MVITMVLGCILTFLLGLGMAGVLQFTAEAEAHVRAEMGRHGMPFDVHAWETARNVWKLRALKQKEEGTP